MASAHNRLEDFWPMLTSVSVVPLAELEAVKAKIAVRQDVTLLSAC